MEFERLERHRCSDFCKSNITDVANIIPAKEQGTKAVGVFCCFSKLFSNSDF